jgi:hypothetical protein
MLPGMTPIIKPLFRVSASKALQMLGLTASLVLDAGDIASYDGTSQTFLWQSKLWYTAGNYGWYLRWTA